MRFRLLGVPHIERATGVTGRRIRVLASMLALNANKHVSFNRLIDALWEECPPVTAREQVQNCVSMLRRALRDQRTPVAIDRLREGYKLYIDPEEVDAHCFERDYQTAIARASAGDLDIAADLMQAALALWRGPALDGMESAELRAHAWRLNDMRTAAMQRMLEFKLELECENEVIPELRSLTILHPLHEPYMMLLTRALKQQGQHREALAAYDAFARCLKAELGAKPSPQAQAIRAEALTALINTAVPTETRNGPVPGSTQSEICTQPAGLLATVEPRPANDLLRHLEKAVLHIRAASVLLTSPDGTHPPA